MNNIRKGLRRFVDTALPTDLVLLVRTGEARSLLQPLTNDRDALRSTIEALRYSTSSRKGVWPFGDVIQGLHGPEVEEAVSRVQREASIQGTLAALNLVVQAARDLPGRKAVILASEGFPLNLNAGEAMRSPGKDDNTRVHSDVDRVIDQATRSGVVIYATNGTALRSGGLGASDDYHQTADTRDPFASREYTGGEIMAGEVRHLAAGRRDDLRSAQAALEYLAEQTGGFAVGNTNDLASAFARIGKDVRDYYVIGYQPDHETFALKDKTPRLHSIVVNVKRAGLRVRTRKEFIGVTDEQQPSGPPTAAQQLVLAARSPFTGTSIPMHVTNLAGYAVDLVGLVINNDGVQIDTIATGFNLTLENAAAEQGIKEGLVYIARVLNQEAGRVPAALCRSGPSLRRGWLGRRVRERARRDGWCIRTVGYRPSRRGAQRRT
jgi:VWFA-related protein